MGIAADALMMIKAQLCDQIDALADQLPHLSSSQLANQVDILRRTARDHGLLPLGRNVFQGPMPLRDHSDSG